MLIEKGRTNPRLAKRLPFSDSALVHELTTANLEEKDRQAIFIPMGCAIEQRTTSLPMYTSSSYDLASQRAHATQDMGVQPAFWARGEDLVQHELGDLRRSPPLIFILLAFWKIRGNHI